jgi:hypothetical protein
MRRIATWLMALGLGAGLVVAAAAQQQPTDAQGVLAAARRALGGDATLAGVKSFSVSGRLTMNLGELNLDHALEIDCELPDKFLRTRTVRSQGPGVFIDVTQRDGFNGEDPIRETVVQDPLGLPPPPDINRPRTPDEVAKARKRGVLDNKHDFTTLALALFAASFSSYPLEFTYAGQVQMEDGAAADVVDAKGEDGFSLRLFVDTKTHLPVMISWRQAPMVIATQTSMVAVPRGTGAPPLKSPPPPTVPPPPDAPARPLQAGSFTAA